MRTIESLDTLAATKAMQAVETPAEANFVRQFPPLSPAGPSVDLAECVEKGTRLVFAVSVFLAVLGFLIGTLVSSGLLLIGLIIGVIGEYAARKRALAKLRGSAVEVGPNQLPELYGCAQEFAQRLGMTKTPMIYIAEGNVLNAVAARVAGRQVIVLVDDVVDACLRSGEPRTLAFIIGHEMAHHALGHTGWLCSYLGLVVKHLSRLNEFSADAVAARLVDAPQVSAQALTLLLTGPQLLPYLDLNSLLVQARQVANDKHSKRAERQLTHPLLLRRLSRFIQ